MVDKRRKIPTNSYILFGAISVLLSLIYIGSPLAYYAMTLLSIVALLQCWVFSISCVLWRRIYHRKTLPHAQFALGKCGIPINCLAINFNWWSFFWCLLKLADDLLHEMTELGAGFVMHLTPLRNNLLMGRCSMRWMPT